MGTLDLALREFLRAAMLARKSCIICGGTGAGKTTLLRAMAADIPPEERLVTIEDSLELGLDRFSDVHPDVCVLDEAGKVLARRRLPEGVAGVAGFHDLLGDFVEGPEDVAIAIETDQGLWVAALAGAGYQVYAVNPKAVARYRERYGGGSGAKSDPGDAKAPGGLGPHRPPQPPPGGRRQPRGPGHQGARPGTPTPRTAPPAPGERPPAHLQGVLACCARCLQRRPRGPRRPRRDRQGSHPAGRAFAQPGGRRGGAAPGRAPALRGAPCRGGPGRPPQQAARPPEGLAGAYGAVVTSVVAVGAEMNRQLEALEAEFASHLDAHPDAEIIRSQPGLATVLGARVLGEFGDDPEPLQRC